MNDEKNLIVIETSECPSLSMRSTLSYEFGRDASQELHIRVIANTGRGYVKPAWIALSALESRLLAEDRFTRAAVLDLFQGTSINGAGFVMAVLRKEGVIEAVEEARHAYRYLGSNSLRERMSTEGANDAGLTKASRPKSKKGTLS